MPPSPGIRPYSGIMVVNKVSWIFNSSTVVGPIENGSMRMHISGSSCRKRDVFQPAVFVFWLHVSVHWFTKKTPWSMDYSGSCKGWSPRRQYIYIYRVYKRYILPIGWLYTDYHPLWWEISWQAASEFRTCLKYVQQVAWNQPDTLPETNTRRWWMVRKSQGQPPFGSC